MILTCPACQTRYLIPDGALGASGRQVRCASCKHSWFATPEAAPEPAPEPAAPQPAVETFAGEPVAAAPANWSEWAQEPPIKPRRNWPRLLTWAAILFALLALGGVGALVYFGPGDLPQRLGLARTEVPLVIQVGPPERRTLASGNELLTITGRIVNPTSEAQTVPDIRAELRDAQGRTVYGWTITRPVRELAPGAEAEFDTAAVDVPRGAQALNLSFADGAIN